MKLIGTHDCATGEKPLRLWMYGLIPFARTLSKTIQLQLDSGSTMFDIRVKKVNDTWHCAHGLYVTNKTAWEILSELNQAVLKDKKIYVCITYEGKLDTEEEKQEFIDWINTTKEIYLGISYGPIAVKYLNNGIKVGWGTILQSDEFWTNKQGFLSLDGHSWHTYVPLPWLWNFIYTRKHDFNEEYYLFVDFL